MHAVHKRAVLGVGGRGRVSSSAQVNYYAVLEVDVEASAEDIKRAYRQRAKQLHPDLNRSPGESPVSCCKLCSGYINN